MQHGIHALLMTQIPVKATVQVPLLGPKYLFKEKLGPVFGAPNLQCTAIGWSCFFCVV
jgi:hypothetical protein